MPAKTSNRFWADFVSGLRGPANKRRVKRRLLVAGEHPNQDAVDTLRSLQEHDFWFDEEYQPVIDQLQDLFARGLISTSPGLLRDGADIGHGQLVTEAGRQYLG